jgi:hypothetical protein
VRVAERSSLANERLRGIGREEHWVGGGLREPVAIDLETADEHGERLEREPNLAPVLSSCRSRSYASGKPFTVASRPVSRPIAVPALPRASSATSGFSFCGIIDDPVAAASGRFAKPNSAVAHSTISSPIRERWTKRTAAAYR